tara:strand:- start:424 stop:708 length:285 start_codon:yes stop_codon:yes gene_type:complete
MEFYSLFLPDFYGSALVNNDYSGLNDDDEKSLHNLTEYWKDDLDFSVVDVPSDENACIESFFMTNHDAKDFGVLACDCWEYKILIKPNSPLLKS